MKDSRLLGSVIRMLVIATPRGGPGLASESMQERISTQVSGPIGDGKKNGKAVVKQGKKKTIYKGYNNKNGG